MLLTGQCLLKFFSVSASQLCSAISPAPQRKLVKQKDCLLGGVYLRDTEILPVF